MNQIVVLDGHTLNPGDLDWRDLETLGTLTVYDRTPAVETQERAQNAHIILTNKVVLDANIIPQLPNLRYIGVLATGYNVVDVATAHAHDITVTNIPDYGTDSVAQMAIAHLLSMCHRVEHHSKLVKAGYWSSAPDWCFWDTPQIELVGKTIGIFGFGRIGHQIGRIASAMGMEVQAYNPTQRQVDDIPRFRWVDSDTLFRTSNVVSLNCPVTPQTERIINHKTLAMMKPSAFLLNVSRGGLVAEQDLADALNDGQIAGAGLDVLSIEPPQTDNPLISAKNAFITPHIAWATRSARIHLMTYAIDNIRAFLEGQAINVVKP